MSDEHLYGVTVIREERHGTYTLIGPPPWVSRVVGALIVVAECVAIAFTLAVIARAGK